MATIDLQDISMVFGLNRTSYTVLDSVSIQKYSLRWRRTRDCRGVNTHIVSLEKR